MYYTTPLQVSRVHPSWPPLSESIRSRRPYLTRPSVTSWPRRSVQPCNSSSGRGAYSHGSRRNLFLKFPGAANYINEASSSGSHLDHLQNSENEKEMVSYCIICVIKKKKKRPTHILALILWLNINMHYDLESVQIAKIGVDSGSAKSTCHNLFIPNPFHWNSILSLCKHYDATLTVP